MRRTARHRVVDLSRELRADAVALTREVFGDVPELRGRFYYDSEPEWLFTAHEDTALVGIRPVVVRTITHAGREVRLAGGIIPSVRPAWRGRGHARALTEHVLTWMREEDIELSLAFVFEEAMGAYLTPYGYRRVRARFTYEDAEGVMREEGQPAFARALVEGEALLGSLEASEGVHLGRGCF